ncbi:BamA/TamA family outer membrane protein [Candidatus Bipolaricaulota bacterium]|nr:BamA/TamA family outer membrane protein [Candidatus Bipolaricaulota bacterium]
MKRALALILGLIVAGGIVTGARATDFPLTVAGIQVDGNTKIRTQEIRKAVPFHLSDEITADDLKSASQAIFDLGWFSEVIPEVDEEGMILFRVVENPVVDKVEITGNVNKESIEILGLTLFRARIMPSDKIRRILRDHGVKKGEVLNNHSLKEGLEAVIDAYEKKGYTLIMVGKVVPGEILRIEIIEGRVTDNVITGLNTVPTEIAQEMIDLPVGECLKKAAIQRTLARLKRLIFFTNVEIVPQQGTIPDEVRLLWTLTERKLVEEPIEITGIDLDGVTRFPQKIADASLKEIPTGEIDNYGLLQALEGLYDLYYRTGYVMVRFSVGSIEAGRLSIHMEEGKIGEITLDGNTHTKDYVIMKTFGIKVGDVLNQARLAVSYQGLMALGYFNSVDIVPEWSDDAIHLSIAVVENEKLGGINGSIAYSPKSGGLVGKLDYSQKNLLGTGQDLSFSYSRGLIGERSAVWNLGYSTVSFFPGFSRVGFDLYRKSEEKAIDEEEPQTFLTVGGRGSVSYPWADYTDLDLSYKHEAILRSDDPLWHPLDSVTIGLRFDDVNNPRFPTAGSRRALSLEKAGGFASGPDFSKLNLQWVHFSPVHLDLPFLSARDQVVAIRLVLGWGQYIPFSQAYDLGGPTTIRGTEVSPARRLCYANIEYRLAVVEGLTGVLFFDSGVNLDRVNPDWAKASFGVELGVEAAGMYVRLDMAWVLGPDLGWVPQFNFGFSPMF